MPYLPVLYSSTWNSKKAIELFDECKDILYKDSMLIDLVYMIQQKSLISKTSYVAILDNSTDKKFVGTIKMSKVLKFLRQKTDDICIQLKTRNT